MVQVAHAASKKIGSKEELTWLLVALARKILCILQHLLMNQEMYEERGFAKRNTAARPGQSSHREFTAQEMIDILRAEWLRG